MSDAASRPSLRARQMVKQDQARASASVDAYPDAPVVPPRVRLFIIAFTDDGQSYDGEPIDTDGLSGREFIPGLSLDSRRRWLVARIVAAHARLLERISSGGE